MQWYYIPDEAILNHIVDLVDQALRQNNALHTFFIGRALGGSAAGDAPSVRKRFGDAIKERTSIRVHYPEGLFDELILSDRLDLISLETRLADSVDAVVVCIESNGSIAELGAFANNPDVAPKLFVIANRSTRADKSFINLGPIRYLRTKMRTQVIWHNFDAEPNPKQIEKIVGFVRARREKQPLTKNWHSPIRLELLIHFLVMIYQPIAEHELLAVVKHIADDDRAEEAASDLVLPVARAVVQRLCKDGWLRRELRARPTFKRLQMEASDKAITYPTHLSLATEWAPILKRYSYEEFVPDIEERLLYFRVRAMNVMFREKR